jgi:hypothetical protein
MANGKWFFLPSASAVCFCRLPSVLSRPLIMQRSPRMRILVHAHWAIHAKLLWERPLLLISARAIIVSLFNLAETRHNHNDYFENYPRRFVNPDPFNDSICSRLRYRAR